MAAWGAMTPDLFDQDAPPPVQQALFALPDPVGTPDMFAFNDAD